MIIAHIFGKQKWYISIRRSKENLSCPHTVHWSANVLGFRLLPTWRTLRSNVYASSRCDPTRHYHEISWPYVCEVKSSTILESVCASCRQCLTDPSQARLQARYCDILVNFRWGGGHAELYPHAAVLCGCLFVKLNIVVYV